jgi:ectoine hydroxylase-related dioxygenase (phytanoyl-CoA dioxygenase family)
MSDWKTVDSPIAVQTHPPVPLPSAGRSQYHLSEEQIRFFDENGYLILRNWMTGELLERLQKAGTAWMEKGQALYEQKQIDPSFMPADFGEDYVYAKRENGDVFFRVNYLHNKAQAASLELLGSPQVLGVAESLCGQNFVPTYESMVFKQKGDGEQIPWHQDAVHPRKYRIFNFDLYLDPSKIGGGALRVVPKSQKQIHDVCDIRDNYGWDVPGVIHVEMEAGDVLLHDVMVLHGSEQVMGKALRRTIYYEFRAAEEIFEEGPWDRDWLDKRMRLIPVALETHTKQFPQREQFQWQVSQAFKPVPLGDTAVELKVAHQIHMPGSYCSAGKKN